MGASALSSSRSFIGAFFKRLAQDMGASWIQNVSMEFSSKKEMETYKWLGQTPAMREWIGGRQAKGLFDNSIAITNKRYEASLEVLLADLERDDTGQTLLRINELADRTNAHWAKLLSALVVAGESTVCYDGQFFFDTDHTEGNNTTSQSNDLSIDISALPASVSGSTTAPSPQEMQLVVMQCIEAMLGFKDNENEPMNENANSFLVMAPTPLLKSASAAVYDSTYGSGETNTIRNLGFDIKVVANPRLSWTEQVAVFRTDGNVKPFIRQNEKAVTLKAQAEGSQIEFEEDKWRFGVDARRNVGYGYWQHACIATMT